MFGRGCFAPTSRGQINTAFKRRWFVLNSKSGALTYAKEPASGVLGVLRVAGADVTVTTGEDGVAELHLKCETSSRVYVFRGDALDEWAAELKKLA